MNLKEYSGLKNLGSIQERKKIYVGWIYGTMFRVSKKCVEIFRDLKYDTYIFKALFQNPS